MYDPQLIRAEMARQRVTLEELATRTGLTLTGVHKATSPGGNPTAKTLDAIANALGVTSASFFACDFNRGVNRAPTAS